MTNFDLMTDLSDLCSLDFSRVIQSNHIEPSCANFFFLVQFAFLRKITDDRKINIVNVTECS